MGMPMHKIIEHDAITQSTIERDANKDELAQMKIDAVNAEAKQAEAEAKATAKAQLLARLGITADEAKLLLA